MDNDQLYNAFLEWLGCNNCVYLQGLSSMDRRPIECISAVMTKNLKALVVGSFDKNIKDELVKIYGDQLEHKYILSERSNKIKLVIILINVCLV